MTKACKQSIAILTCGEMTWETEWSNNWWSSDSRSKLVNSLSGHRTDDGCGCHGLGRKSVVVYLKLQIIFQRSEKEDIMETQWWRQLHSNIITATTKKMKKHNHNNPFEAFCSLLCCVVVALCFCCRPDTSGSGRTECVSDTIWYVEDVYQVGMYQLDATATPPTRVLIWLTMTS